MDGLCTMHATVDGAAQNIAAAAAEDRALVEIGQNVALKWLGRSCFVLSVSVRAVRSLPVTGLLVEDE